MWTFRPERIPFAVSALTLEHGIARTPKSYTEFLASDVYYFVTKSTLTLTQSGLLAVLLERQRRKAIESARRRQNTSIGMSLLSTLLGDSPTKMRALSRSAKPWCEPSAPNVNLLPCLPKSTPTRSPAGESAGPVILDTEL